MSGSVSFAKTFNMGRINWKDPNNVVQFTEKVLWEEFQLRVNLPRNTLCPPLPNRLNYIHWLNELLNLRSDMNFEKSTVLDIGTGASCIYPFLGSKLFGWRFLASDINSESLAVAHQNILQNPALTSDIMLLQVKKSESLQTALTQGFLTQHVPEIHSSDKPLPPVQYRSLRELLSSPNSNQFRGPIREALVSYCDRNSSASIVEQAERDFNNKPFSPLEPIVHAVMCNPPFYDLVEEVSIRYTTLYFNCCR